MIKKISLFLLSILLLLFFTYPAAAKSKHNSPSTAEIQPFIKQVFSASEEKINQLAQFDLTKQETSLTLYLSSQSNYSLTKRKIKFITNYRGNWRQVTWQFGVAPILTKDGILTFRRLQPSNNLPPNQKNFRYFNKGVKEQLTTANDKYIYI